MRRLVGLRALVTSTATAALVLTAVTALPSPAAAATTTYKVTIKRTSYGVPHISANDIGSAAFGQGWAYAEDRFCDLMDMVIKVRSQRSKYFGAAPDLSNVISDYGYLQLGIMDLARQQNARLSTEERQILDGYVAGFNGLLNKVGAAHVPGWCAGMPWVGPITAVDVLAYQRDLALLASGDQLLAPAWAAQPPPSVMALAAAPLVRQGFQHIEDFKNAAGTGLGSNGWGIGADKSQTGKGLLLANPHFPWEGELRFWESQLTVPNNINVYGASLGGLPGVQIGYTDKVAWTHTISTGTRFTFYQVGLVPGNPTSYYVDGTPEAMTHKTFTIQVKQPDGSLQPDTRTLYSTRYGPVLDLSAIDPSLGWTTDTAMTYRDANITNDKMLHQWFNIARAADVNGINSAIAGDQGIPWVNVIASDATGNAYYSDPSQTPLLNPTAQNDWASDQNPLGILNGSDSANAWQTVPGQRTQGLTPFSRQPKLTRRDYTFNANDSHWVANANRATFLTGFNKLQGPELSPLTVRSRQNVKLLEGTAKFSVDGVGAAIYSDTAFTSDQLVNAVIAGCTSAPCNALRNWDRRFDPASRGAVLWRETIAAVIAAYPGQNVLNNVLNGDGPLWGVPFNRNDPGHTPRGAPANLTPLRQALDRATALLASRGYPPDVPLSQVQFTEKNGQKIPVPGSNENVGIANAVYYQFPGQAGSSTSLEPGMDLGTPLDGTDMTTRGYPVNYGTSFLLTMGFTASGPSAKAVLTFGESGNPASPNFSDQTRLFSNKQLRDAWYTDAQISADTKSVEVLVQVTITN